MKFLKKKMKFDLGFGFIVFYVILLLLGILLASYSDVLLQINLPDFMKKIVYNSLVGYLHK
jgi:hypothetical protein